MENRCFHITKLIICAGLICLLTVPSQALANIWNLLNGLLDLFDSNKPYNGYTAGSRDEKTQKGKPSALAVFIMTSSKHDELFICRENSDHSWEIESQSTVAVYQPTKEGNLYPKIEIIDDTVFRISYQSTPINETFDFQYQDGQWFLSAVEIVGPSEKITCQKTDAGLQFDIPSRFSCIVPNISLSDFNIARFPKSEEQLKQWQTALHKVTCVLPQSIRIEGTIKKTLPVHTGPTKKAHRAGNKKAAISLKEAYSVYGTHDGWTMVEYKRNIRNSRIGWVEKLSLDTDVPTIDWSPVPAVTISATALTDDPHVGQASMVTVPEASKIEVLACLEPWWAYISVTIKNVQYFGFIPLDSLRFE